MAHPAPRTGAAPMPDGDAVARLVGMADDAALGNEDWLAFVRQMSGTVGASRSEAVAIAYEHGLIGG